MSQTLQKNYSTLPRSITRNGKEYLLMRSFGQNGYVTAYVHNGDFADCLLSSAKQEKEQAAAELWEFLENAK